MRRLLKRFAMRIALHVLLARERLESGVSFNPLLKELQSYPYPFYRRLREKSPVHRSRLVNGWVLTRHADIDMVLRDHKRFVSDERTADGKWSPAQDGYARSMLNLDPPDHTRLRSLVSQAFTPRAVQQFEARIEQLVDELLDKVEDSETFDVLEALAAPLPLIVIAEMLGVPTEDRERFTKWSNRLARRLEPTISEEETRLADESRDALTDYFGEIIKERQPDPNGDFISALLAVEEEGDKLTHEELLTTLVLLLVAGNETAKNLIDNGIVALLQHPDQLQRLRDNPDLMESTIDELLRFDSPVQMDGRTVSEDVVVGGKQMRRGQLLMLLIGAANRDPQAFPDPDRLDIGRDDKSHISFGRGIHHCLGAPLARIEGKIAFRKLIERYSEISFAEPPVFRDHIVLRGLRLINIRVKRADAPEASPDAKPLDKVSASPRQ